MNQPAPQGASSRSDEEAAALAARWQAAEQPPKSPEQRLGLALSGGGIRSATFCLGLLRGLAKNKVLQRFDYLSTVSGGGYIGAAFGRLFNAQVRAAQVEEGLARDDSLFLWWLRSNGRFLTPAGAGDLFTAWAGHLRGFIATQLETGVLLLMLSALLVAPHLWLAARPDASAWAFYGLLLGSPLWTAALLMLPLAAASMFGFWFSGDNHLSSRLGAAAAAALGLALLLQILPLPPLRTSENALEVDLWAAPAWVASSLLLALVIGAALRVLLSLRFKAEQLRVLWTQALAWMLIATALLLVFGALDFLSWVLSTYVLQQSASAGASGLGLGALLLGALRLVLPMLQRQADKTSGASLPLPALAHVLGLLLLAMVMMFWMSLAQLWVFLLQPQDAAAPLAGWLPETPARWQWLVVTLLAYMLLTGRHLQQLNRSSLHLFYRSRLTRTYVAVGNAPAPGCAQPRFPRPLLARVDREATEHTRKLSELLPQDDIALADYQPWRHGGPIHLINCCINQTKDDRTGSYNADRKGVALTVSALGLETGAQLPQGGAGGTLAEWVAISGAAISSGMGSQTRTGVAALLFLANLRLGYWLRNPLEVRGRFARLLWQLWGKYCGTGAEMLASFPGLRGPAWYLSDGGHFDNTGIYALLKRRLPLMVLADCGADPLYVFNDVENLVRKARIDYGADIEFIDPRSLPCTPQQEPLRELFDTPDGIGPRLDRQYLMLARVRYEDGSLAALLIVKPRRSAQLPLDVAGYADRDGGFPQQTTGDQFFDEAQWESYCELGLRLGAAITPELLALLPQWAAAGKPADNGQITPPPKDEPQSRGRRVAATVGTSLGVGAVASVLLTLWQSWDAHAQRRLEAQTALDQKVQDVVAEIDKASQDIATSKSYDDQLRIKLLAVVNARQSLQGDKPVAEILQSQALRLQKVCKDNLDGDAQNRCLVDVRLLDGEKLEGFWLKQLRDYRLWRVPEAAAAPTTMKSYAPAPGAAPQPEAMDGAAYEEAPAAGAPVPVPADQPALPMGDTVRRDCAADPAAARPRYTLYTQIYAEPQRAPAEALLAELRERGLATPGIENVVRSAQRRNQDPPLPWSQPTLLYQPESKDCAEALAAYLRLRPAFRQTHAQALPAGLSNRSGVIELWLPAGRN
ncbi:Patatin-like phospholipase [Solimonas aquatica]|uniref:Patatin-like phospholipase n=1 Tax=Solimonas aquatica TaxID=489703 RepID=A0A1H9F4V9_9GAMM|nr:patatin-like phospholipase family protein [Solimonas aquatica]SEQ32915.1 Patatin-like phospholipase [Solimonas aquatica]